MRYPWSELRVGETRDVYDVPSRGAATQALLKWRDKGFRLGADGHGLGYTPEHCPLFHISYDRERCVARITRMPDGPMRGREGGMSVGGATGGRPASAQRLEAARRQRAADKLVTQAHAEVDAWIAENVARRARGDQEQMFPLERLDQIRSVAPALADEIGQIDTRVNRAEEPHRLRRATDTKAYSTAQDKPTDASFCARLTSACKSSQSR